jgi:putative redox protein
VSEDDGTRTAVARWVGGWRCDVQTGGFGLVVDEPVEDGGEGAGPAPTDLFLASMCSCYALSVAWAARKRGFELPDLVVTADGTYDGLRFGTVVLTVTSSLADERLEPLLEPARRVCYVSNTIVQSPQMSVRIGPAASGEPEPGS